MVMLRAGLGSRTTGGRVSIASVGRWHVDVVVTGTLASGLCPAGRRQVGSA
jgi:hypothetical protein